MAKRFAVMRDLQDHLEAGRISAFDLGIYTIIHWQADFKTGVWRGSAAKIHATAPRGCSLRDVQRSIQTMTCIGFLKPFHKHGQRGNHPVLIDKYEPLSGALRNFRLNAAESKDWKTPVYSPCALTDAQAAPIQYAVCNTKPKPKAKPRAAKPAAPADPRRQPFIEFAFESYRKKHRQVPNWNVKDFNGLKALLRKNQTLTSVELERRWTHYEASTEAFTVKQGDSLAYFCAKFDSFLDGPILRPKTKGAFDSNASDRALLAGIEQAKPN